MRGVPGGGVDAGANAAMAWRNGRTLTSTTCGRMMRHPAQATAVAAALRRPTTY